MPVHLIFSRVYDANGANRFWFGLYAQLALALCLLTVGRVAKAQCYSFSSGSVATFSMNIPNLPKPTVGVDPNGNPEFLYNLPALPGNSASFLVNGISIDSVPADINIQIDSGPLGTDFLLSALYSNSGNITNAFNVSIHLWAAANPSYPEGLLPNGLPATLPLIAAWTDPIPDTFYGAITTPTGSTSISNPTVTAIQSECSSPPPTSGPPADTLAITTTALPSTISGDLYSAQLTATGGVGTITWSLGGGSLPEGFTLSSTGLLSNSGTPPPLAEPGTYTLTVTTSDSQISVSKQLHLEVISENCADTATIDPTKIRVLTYKPLTLIPEHNFVYLNPGFTLLGKPLPFYGISITTQPDAVTYAANGIPSSQIQLVYVQNLTNWSGYSEYTGPGGTTKGWGAIPVSSPEVDYPPSSPPIYYGLDGIFDSPQADAPIRTPSSQQLTAMHYNKAFTAYIGCHTARDNIHFESPDPNEPPDPRYYIRTLATVNWGVNYFGSISFSPQSCINAVNRFNCFTFTPDSAAGVYFSPPAPVPQGESDEYEPADAPAAKTSHTCFNGGTCP